MTRSFLFARHGETEPNTQGLRCGGDNDVPLTARGLAQAHDLAAAVAGRNVEIVITSPLIRTVSTAEIVARALGLAVQIEPLLIERKLGAWNGRSIAETEPLLRAGETPPGGEAEHEFRARVGRALQALEPHLAAKPLVISSKGVARMTGLLLGAPDRPPAGNAEILEFFVK